MQPHQERVVNERTDLSDKVTKLGIFIGGSTFSALVYEERERLSRQLSIMQAYLAVLNERIAAF